jgi:methyl-accepting chemotaxis protein
MDRHTRKKYFIDRQFQAKFAFISCLIVASSSVLIGALLYYMSRHLTTVTIANTHVTVKSTADFMLPVIIKTLALATIFNAALVITLTIYMSHRIAGPLYRLCRDLEAFRNGDMTVSFKTRKTDELKPLVSSLVDTGEALRIRISDIKKRYSEVKRAAADSSVGKESMAHKLQELGETIDFFKT